MRTALPDNFIIRKEAKQDMERYAVEFILFITGEGSSDPSISATLLHPIKLTHFSRSAAENVLRANRKILEGDDVLKAMNTTGFERYAEALTPYLEGFKARERRGVTFDLKLEEENEETVAAGKRRRAPTPESPPSSP